jgi:hypothetical protein
MKEDIAACKDVDCRGLKLGQRDWRCRKYYVRGRDDERGKEKSVIVVVVVEGRVEGMKG